MSKHTPGPWKVTEFMPDENGENLITDTYQEICAGAGYLDNDPGGTMIGFSCTGCMTKHDAHLIAAAPEMYEALKGMLHLWAETAKDAMPDELFKKATNAVLKAEGRTT